MFLDIKLCSFLFLLGCRDHHGFVRAVDLEEYCHLFADVVFPVLAFEEGLVLGVGVFLVD